MKINYTRLPPFESLTNVSALIPCKEGAGNILNISQTIAFIGSIQNSGHLFEFKNGKIQAVFFEAAPFTESITFEFSVDLKTQPEWLKTFTNLSIPNGSIKMEFEFLENGARLKNLNFSCRELLYKGEPGKYFKETISNAETGVKLLDEILHGLFKNTYIIDYNNKKLDLSVLRNDASFKKVLRETSLYLHTINKAKWDVVFSTESDELIVEKGNIKQKLSEVQALVKWNTLLTILACASKVEPFNQMPLIFFKWPEKYTDKVILKNTLEVLTNNHVPYIILTESPEILAIHSKLKGRMVKL